MKINPAIFAATIVSVVAAGFSYFNTPQATGANSPAPYQASVAWEYQLVRLGVFLPPPLPLSVEANNIIDKDAVQKFEWLGKQGWELVDIAEGVAVFKRPL